MGSVSGGIDGLEAVFDDGSLVSDGGLLLVGTVVHRLGLEALIDAMMRLDGRVAGSGPGRKVLTLVATTRAFDRATGSSMPDPSQPPESPKPRVGPT